MSVINVTQFSTVSANSRGSLLCAETPFISSENITGGASSVQSTAFAAGCNVIRVCTDTNVRIAFGTNPTATSSSLMLREGTAEYFGVTAGMKLATIDG